MLLGYTIAHVCPSLKEFIHQTVSPQERVGSGDETDPNAPRTELKPTARALFLVLSFYMDIDNTIDWENFTVKK